MRAAFRWSIVLPAAGLAAALLVLARPAIRPNGVDSEAQPRLFDPELEAAAPWAGPLAAGGTDVDALAPAASLDELRARIARIAEVSGGAGVAVALVEPSGAIFSDGFGEATLGRAPMTEKTLFRVGSLTKPFIALAILRLVEQGRLRLEDRLSDLAPEIAAVNRWHRSHPIQVAHLLEHTAGFDEMRFSEIFEPQGRQDRPLVEVLAKNPRSRVARWRPGTRFSYSQPGFTVAAYLIEKTTGMPYERYLAEEVFAPLGIEGASLRLSPETRARLATGYHRRQRVDPVYLWHRPAGNLAISAEGLARLMALQIGRGEIQGRRFLSPASLERMERCGTLPHAPPSTCYGLGNWGDVGGPMPMRGHGGFVPGYFGFYRYSPRYRFGLAVLVNDTSMGPTQGRVAFEIFRYLMRGVSTPPPRPPVALVDPAQYVGTYRLVSPGVEFLRFRTDVYEGISVSEENGRLFLDRRGRPRRALLPTGPDLFRFPRDADSSVRFFRTAEGRAALTVSRGTFERESATWAALRRGALEIAIFLLFCTLAAPAVAAGVRQRAATAMVLLPFAAALCLFAMSRAFATAHEAGLLGVASGPTVLVWILSWAFALLACAALKPALTGLFRPGGGVLKTYALATAFGVVWIALHLSRYGLIGLRTWMW